MGEGTHGTSSVVETGAHVVLAHVSDAVQDLRDGNTCMGPQSGKI